MWKIVFFAIFLPWVMAQKHRNSRQSENPNRWDIRLAVPGEPGNDYPTLGAIPRTTFSCAGREPGYYADIETKCQVFRVCTAGSTYGFQSFLCPNGTLFNQAVFVCDWWMNVNCDKSQQFFFNNNERFSNLRLGPQLMQDIKKMLTHPMRNPYDISTMKSNLIVMQEYIPPAGQMLPDGAYYSAKQIQSTDQNGYDNVFAASSPSPTYVPPLNTASMQGDAEVFQRQRQNAQYAQNGKLVQAQRQTPIGFTKNSNFIAHPTQAYSYGQFIQGQSVLEAEQFESQREFFNLRNSGFMTNNIQNQTSNNIQNSFGLSDARQQYNALQNNQEKQNFNIRNGYSAPVVKKTLTYNRIIQDPKSGNPKSRITFKTWIAKPTKAAKLIASEPTPYIYNVPTQPPTQKLVEQPYVYNPPSTTAQPERIFEDNGYEYRKPTISSRQIIKNTIQPSNVYLSPTAPPPTLSRIYLTPTNRPTQASKLYLAPTTYKPANIFIPTTQSTAILSRQYLTPNTIQQTPFAQNEKLQASPTTPTLTFIPPTNTLVTNPSFSLTKHSHINANHNNLTFADILTKEKLDITVNDIVSDTSKILKTAAPHVEQYREEKTQTYVEPYLSQQISESGEILTPESPTLSTSAKLVSTLSNDLEPPFETNNNNNIQTVNRLSHLPFFKEPATNTIERTVSLKISIPEKLASYLFRSQNESDFDKLEILNTGSSNYLVLTNNLLAAKNSGASFIPIGKLVADKNSNLSSQSLVFSLLADSLNVAKGYNNVAQKNINSGLAQLQQYQQQKTNNEDVSEFTNRISQLTASHYSNNNNINPTNTESGTQTQTNSDQFLAAKYTANFQKQPQQIQRPQTNSFTNPSGGFVAQIQSNLNGNLQKNNQIYSGQLYQLPVPEVTKQIYNADASIIQNSRLQSSPNQIQNHNNAVVNNNAVNNLSNEQVEHTKVLPQPAKLQATPLTTEEFNNQQQSNQAFNNIIENGNGISAQINDHITGTIPHPTENRLVTYKKNQSYYVYSKINNNPNEIQNNNVNNFNLQSAKIIQNAVEPNLVSIQLVPSISYQLDNEKDKQALLNAFQLDEYGNPKNLNSNPQKNINYYANQASAKQIDGRFNNDINNLYTGPSSYSAPQSSVGSLEVRENSNQINDPNTGDVIARIEELDGTNGYAKRSPARQFQY